MPPSIKYTPKFISPEETQDLLEGGRFTSIDPTKRDQDMSYLVLPIPTSAKPNNRSTLIYLEQMNAYLPPLSPGLRSKLRSQGIDPSRENPYRSIYFADVVTCSAKNCEKEADIAHEKSLSLDAWKVLPLDFSFVNLYYGDANKDGYNDVLFTMSNGAGFVFYSKK